MKSIIKYNYKYKFWWRKKRLWIEIGVFRINYSENVKECLEESERESDMIFYELKICVKISKKKPKIKTIFY